MLLVVPDVTSSADLKSRLLQECWPALGSPRVVVGEAWTEDAWLALLEFLSAFGRPHVHAGLGIRKLAPHVFECRAGLRLRLVIRDKPEALEAQFLGTHDEIRRLKRDL